MFYTGIGSRKTPKNILASMEGIASSLAQDGYTLRSGAAEGADSAFEHGCDKFNGLKEIYLPWKEFNNSISDHYYISEQAIEIASKIHPNWDSLSQGAQKLHARNCYQILGKDLKTSSLFVVCWTKGGLAVGGTRTAIILAQEYNIPVFNLATENFSIDKISYLI